MYGNPQMFQNESVYIYIYLYIYENVTKTVYSKDILIYIWKFCLCKTFFFKTLLQGNVII